MITIRSVQLPVIIVPVVVVHLVTTETFPFEVSIIVMRPRAQWLSVVFEVTHFYVVLTVDLITSITTIVAEITQLKDNRRLSVTSRETRTYIFLVDTVAVRTVEWIGKRFTMANHTRSTILEFEVID